MSHSSEGIMWEQLTETVTRVHTQYTQDTVYHITDGVHMGRAWGWSTEREVAWLWRNGFAVIDPDIITYIREQISEAMKGGETNAS